jgi:dimethylamine/trimethylamine dehydrogenase
VGQIERMSNVSVYRESPMSAEDVIEFGAGHVVIATGCHWRRDGFGRTNSAIKGFDEFRAYTPDDVMDGEIPPGPVLLFDDDGYYYGSVIAEALRAAGREVMFVTPAESPAPWTANTLEFPYIQKRLRELDVEIIAAHNLAQFDGAQATLIDVWSGQAREIGCASVLGITARLPNDELYHDLVVRESEWRFAGIKSVQLAGDALAPGAIVHAVYSGHRLARELDEAVTEAPAFRRPIAGPTT